MRLYKKDKTDNDEMIYQSVKKWIKVYLNFSVA